MSRNPSNCAILELKRIDEQRRFSLTEASRSILFDSMTHHPRRACITLHPSLIRHESWIESNSNEEWFHRLGQDRNRTEGTTIAATTTMVTHITTTDGYALMPPNTAAAEQNDHDEHEDSNDSVGKGRPSASSTVTEWKADW